MLRLFKKLIETAPLIHPGSSPGKICKRVKYCVRGLAFPTATAEWLELLETPALAAVVRHRPKLFQKLQRPYLARTLHTAQRLQALTQHYQFALTHFAPPLLREIHSPAGKCLATLPVEGGDPYELHLTSSWMDKEGELTLTLQNRATGIDLFALTFTIARCEAGSSEILIGGLQGNKQANEKDLIIALTRHWHGMRPKALLLYTLHQLAAIWGVTHIRAVGDTTHIYRHWRQRKDVASSYDAWWQEAGGHLAADGIFNLPARFVARDIASLKVNKRQMYRRRYLMLADLASQMTSRLGFSPQNPVPARQPMPTEFGAALIGPTTFLRTSQD